MADILSSALGKIGFDHDVDALISEILLSLTKKLDASSSTFWEYNKVSGNLHLQISCIGTDEGLQIIKDNQGINFPTSFSVKKYRTTRKLYFEEKPFLQVIDLEDPDLADHGAWLHSLGVKAVLQLPVIFLNDFIGWIPVHSCKSPNPWTDSEIALAVKMAEELAIGIRIKELAKQAEYSAKLKERADLAREIHDTLAQDLLGIKLQLEVAEEFYQTDGERFTKHFSKAQQLARESLEEMRKSIATFRSQEEVDKSIIEMTRQLIVNKYDELFVYCEADESFPHLVSEAKYEVYRIISEALSNAYRHADATEISVIFSSNPDVSVQIVDNGKGFSEIKQSDHKYGLEVMQERAQKIDSQLKITSQPQNGTSVEITIPPSKVKK